MSRRVIWLYKRWCVCTTVAGQRRTLTGFPTYDRHVRVIDHLEKSLFICSMVRGSIAWKLGRAKHIVSYMLSIIGYQLGVTLENDT